MEKITAKQFNSLFEKGKASEIIDTDIFIVKKNDDGDVEYAYRLGDVIEEIEKIKGLEEEKLIKEYEKTEEKK